jgi:hypothetical protein
VTTKETKHSISGSLPAAITSRCHHENMTPTLGALATVVIKRGWSGSPSRLGGVLANRRSALAAAVQAKRVHGRAVPALNARTHGLGRDRLVAGHSVFPRFLVSSEHLRDVTRRHPGGLASGLYLFERGPEDAASAKADEFPVPLRLQGGEDHRGRVPGFLASRDGGTLLVGAVSAVGAVGGGQFGSQAPLRCSDRAASSTTLVRT